MRVEWFVARRYLRSPYRPAVLRLVTLLSVIGVGAGVATLVIALAMNTGFRKTIQERLLGVTAHISLSRPGSGGIRNSEELARRLEAIRGVLSVTPAIYQTVLLSYGGQARGVVAKGIDPEREIRSDEALRRIVAGALEFAPDRNGIGAVLVGRILAEEMKLRPGDYITLTSPQGRLTPYGLIPRTRRFRVSGIFDSGFYDYDANWIFMTLPAAQSLAGAPELVSTLEFRIQHVDRVDEVARAVEREVGEGYAATTWVDQNKALFRALRLEKLVTAIFIGLITFIAGLNILVVLAMTVSDKARDIAVLMAMGARGDQIRRIFLWQGIAIGAVGTLSGLLAGYAIAWIAGTYRLIPLDPQVYAVPYVPFSPNAFDAVWVTGAAMAISIGATLMPARSASRISPVDILRYE
ncbi:MAG TPA: ABC transporter permease [Candidatus Dormibacteraeota bacterium]|nr:ABC transporter permease [Candidatus Dormibacteraeota bacterium]